MIIYFRVCEKQQTISNVLRYEDIDKTTLLKKCWLSLQQSVDKADTIVVIHDSVSEDTLLWLNRTNKSAVLQFINVAEHSWDYHQHTVELVNTLLIRSEQYPEEIHYIVEDDYLHTSAAITSLKANLANWNFFATSYDYPDRYRGQPENSLILLGTDRHWRTVSSATMTLLAKGKVWLAIKDALKAAAPTSNDTIFTEVFKHMPCISPMPGLASHMTQHHTTPLVDWTNVWNSITLN